MQVDISLLGWEYPTTGQWQHIAPSRTQRNRAPNIRLESSHPRRERGTYQYSFSESSTCCPIAVLACESWGCPSNMAYVIAVKRSYHSRLACIFGRRCMSCLGRSTRCAAYNQVIQVESVTLRDVMFPLSHERQFLRRFGSGKLLE